MKSNINTWSAEVQKRQWLFIGSVARGESNKWCHQLMHWTPLGTRSVGRPNMRFLDQFHRFWNHRKGVAAQLHLPLEDHWFDTIHDKRKWASHVAAFIKFHAH